MATTFTAGLKGKVEKGIGGLGPRIVEGEVSGAESAYEVSIDAGDIGLKTIYNLQVVGYGAGTYYITKLGTFTPGAIANNYAAITAYGTSGGTVCLGTFRVFAIGE